MTNQTEHYVTLNNGVKMPIIGFGVDTLKGDDVIKSVVLAIKNGYRLIDTAQVYGNEKEVGIAIKQCIDEGFVKREDLFISTKAPYFFPGYEDTLEGYEESLLNLGLDYIDLYLLHHPYREYATWQKEIVSSWKALENLYKNKKVRAIGVCNFSYPYYDVLLHCYKVKPAINQIEVNPQYKYSKNVEITKQNGIQVVAWSALNKGHIVNEPTIKELAKKYNKTEAQIALKWNIQQGNAVLTRSTKEQRIKDSLNIWDFQISKEDMDRINKIPDKNDELRGHTEKSRALGCVPRHVLDDMFDRILNKCPYEKKYKLFGFIPFLRVKKINNRICNYYLFGLRILKTDTK